MDNGVKITIEMEDGTIFKGTASQMSINFSHEAIEVTTAGQQWKEFMPGSKKAEITADIYDLIIVEYGVSSIRSDKTERLLRMIDG